MEAAKALATPTPVILWRHILPNAMAPLIVQGTFVAASAVLLEAILSFLGLGLPPDIPTWGNIMAEGRVQFSQFPGNGLVAACFGAHGVGASTCWATVCAMCWTPNLPSAEPERWSRRYKFDDLSVACLQGRPRPRHTKHFTEHCPRANAVCGG